MHLWARRMSAVRHRVGGHTGIKQALRYLDEFFIECEFVHDVGARRWIASISHPCALLDSRRSHQFIYRVGQADHVVIADEVVARTLIGQVEIIVVAFALVPVIVNDLCLSIGKHRIQSRAEDLNALLVELGCEYVIGIRPAEVVRRGKIHRSVEVSCSTYGLWVPKSALLRTDTKL